MTDITGRNPAVGSTNYPTLIGNLISDLQPYAALPVIAGGYKPSTTSGLTLGYYGGIWWTGSALGTIADGTLVLANNTTNYVEAQANGTISSNTSGFTTGRAPLYTVVTSGGAITTITDKRAPLLAYAQAIVQDLQALGSVILGDAAADTVVMNAKSITTPNKPMSLATLSTNAANQTGDGTAYTVIPDTEIADRAAEYNNATGVATVTVTGLYQLGLTWDIYNLGAGHTKASVRLSTSNRDYTAWFGNPYACSADAELGAMGSILADMDAADTVGIIITVFNSTKTVGIAAGTKLSVELVG
jgi:hypothetical protein